MIAIATPQAEPCAECGTTEGRVDRGCKRPARYNGKRFGLDGVLCNRCYMRLHQGSIRAGVVPTPCDLCDESPQGPRFDAAEFEMEGTLCHGCIEELRDEQRLLQFRLAFLSNLPRRRPQLKRIEDMTPREACDVIRREFRRMRKGAA